MPMLSAFAAVILLQFMLSADNVVALAEIVADSHLPGNKEKLALYLGMAGACLAQFLLLGAGIHLLGLPTTRLLAGGYLIILALGRLYLPSRQRKKSASRSFWPTVAVLVTTSAVFSIDSIAGALTLTTDLPVIFTAVVLSVAVMCIIVRRLAKLLEHNPALAPIAYLLVLWVGVQMWAQVFFGLQVSPPVDISVIVGISATVIAYDRLPLVRKLIAPPLKLVNVPLTMLVVAVYSAVQHSVRSARRLLSQLFNR